MVGSPDVLSVVREDVVVSTKVVEIRSVVVCSAISVTL